MSKLFSTWSDCALVGMVHLLPLPGSPGWGGSMKNIVDAALRDTERLLEGGCDALIVENMGDVPYLRGGVSPETSAAMAVVAEKIVAFGVPVGIQLLAAANREALGAAVASGASFLRAEAFAYAHVADEGWLEASAAELLRARASLGASVEIWADVQKKHAAHAVTADLTLADLAKGTAFCRADALIVTGSSTGMPTSVEDIEAAKTSGLCVAVGSGVTEESAGELASIANALIVGSWLKEEGDWQRPVSLERVKRIKQAMRGE